MDFGFDKKPRIDDTFLKSGECSDEVIFEFDADKKLYVSQNLLTLSSPVFKAMFDKKNNFKESKERKVKIVDKSFEIFREFLCCLHPDIQQAVTITNVLDIVPLAEEYQSRLLVSRCKNVIKKCLSDDRSSCESHHYNFENTHQCLLILNTVLKLNYADLVDDSIVAIARFGSRYFTGEIGCRTPEWCSTTQRSDCKHIFEGLSSNIKLKILIKRLEMCDDHEYNGFQKSKQAEASRLERQGRRSPPQYFNEQRHFFPYKYTKSQF